MARPRQCSIDDGFGDKIIFKSSGGKIFFKYRIFSVFINKSQVRKLRDWLSHWLAESGQ